YEMLTGLRAFERETPAETMTAILKDEPHEFPTRADLSPAFDRIVRHALEKDPNDRFQSARDLAFDLQSLGQGSASNAVARTTAPRARTFHLRELTAWSAATALAIAAASLVWRGRGVAPPARVANLTLSDDADLSASSVQSIGLLVSPDGSRI